MPAPRPDQFYLFEKDEQAEAVTLFMARLICFNNVVPCNQCVDFARRHYTPRAYEAFTEALHRIPAFHRSRAAFYGALHTAGVTMAPNLDGESEGTTDGETTSGM